jgi:hypothetical protein
MAAPDGDYCSMRIIEGTDPEVVTNRVAFIEKTPRVRALNSFDGNDDWKNWHQGWKGDDGWDPVAQGWCDTHLVTMGYIVPEPKPFNDKMLNP